MYHQSLCHSLCSGTKEKRWKEFVSLVGTAYSVEFCWGGILVLKVLKARISELEDSGKELKVRQLRGS